MAAKISDLEFSVESIQTQMQEEGQQKGTQNPQEVADFVIEQV